MGGFVQCVTLYKSFRFAGMFAMGIFAIQWRLYVCVLVFFVFLLSYLKQQTLLRHRMCDSGKSFFIDLCWTSCIKVLNEFYGNP